jgi:hypothetical protein
LPHQIDQSKGNSITFTGVSFVNEAYNKMEIEALDTSGRHLYMKMSVKFKIDDHS